MMIRTLEFGPLARRLWITYYDGSVAFIDPYELYDVDDETLGAWLGILVRSLTVRTLVNVRLPSSRLT